MANELLTPEVCDRPLKAYSDRPDTDGELGAAAYTKSSEIQHDAIDLTVATPAGALAPLVWGREEFNRYYVDEAETPDWLDRFTLKMMDNAIAVLRDRFYFGLSEVNEG